MIKTVPKKPILGKRQPTCIDENRGAAMRQRSKSEIAEKGESLYRKMSSSLLPDKYGKYLAIDVDTEKVYVADSPQDAYMQARKNNLHGAIHLVRIGFDSLYRVASYGQRITR